MLPVPPNGCGNPVAGRLPVMNAGTVNWPALTGAEHWNEPSKLMLPGVVPLNDRTIFEQYCKVQGSERMRTSCRLLLASRPAKTEKPTKWQALTDF